MQAKSARKIGARLLGQGKWLVLEEIQYLDRHGGVHTWEAAARQGGQGAVVIIARLQPSGRYLLIRQYRAPCDGFVLEFPAGLVDAGETAASTAVRELREETGYTGRVDWLSPLVISSAGFSREGFHFAIMTVDEEAPENRQPQQDCETNEDIAVLLAGAAELPALLAACQAEGDFVDSRLLAYFLGQGNCSG